MLDQKQGTSMYSFKILEKVDKDEWNTNLKKSNNATFFQTVEYLINSKHHPLFIYVFDKDKNVVGQLGCLVIKSITLYSNPIIQKISKPLSNFIGKLFWVRGPIIHSNDQTIRLEILNCIIQALNIIAEKYDLIFIEGTSSPCDIVDEKYVEEFKKGGYQINDYITFVTNLNQSIEDIWNNVSKKARGDVTRAKRRNIIVKEVSNKNELIQYLLMHKKWAKTKGIEIDNPLKYLDELWKNYTSNIEKTFLAYQNDNLLSSLRVGIFNRIAITHSVSNLYSQQTNLGGTLLSWYAIEWAKNIGFTIYDYSGGQLNDKHNDINNLTANTLLNYKKKWGGVETPYYQLTKIRKNTYYKLLNALIYPTLISRKLRSKLHRFSNNIHHRLTWKT